MDVYQHNDNEGTLEAAENDEDTEYDKNQCSKITRDGEDHDDVYDDACSGTLLAKAATAARVGGTFRMS